MERYNKAAASIDALKQKDDERNKMFSEHLDKFMSAVPSPGENLSQVEDSFYEIGEGEIEERIHRFTRVRGIFNSIIKQSIAGESLRTKEGMFLQRAIINLEPLLFEQAAYIESVALDEKFSGTRYARNNDEIFNLSLKILTFLGNLISFKAANFSDENTLHRAVNLIMNYYDECDSLIAERFYKSSSKSSDLVRIGPFSYARNNRYEKIKRPAVILNPQQLNMFRDQFIHQLSGCTNSTDIIESIVGRIGSEPVSFVVSC